MAMLTTVLTLKTETVFNNFFKTVLYLTLFVWLSPTVNAELKRYHTFDRGQVFDARYERYTTHDFITGQLIYIIDEGLDEEGYQPLAVEHQQGHLHELIVDYPASHSALGKLRAIRRDLIQRGYQIYYECERHACGDAQAWPLFVSSLTAGAVDTQFYLFAQRLRNQQRSTVSVYINEYSSEPRAVFHQIVNNGATPLQLSLNGQPYTAQTDAIEHIYFDTDAASLTDQSQQALQRVMQNRRNSQDGLLITGHADPRGTHNYNQQLSEQRAQVVAQQLQDMGADAQRLFIRAEGERPVPLRTNQAESAISLDPQAQQRRVSLYYITRDGLPDMVTQPTIITADLNAETEILDAAVEEPSAPTASDDTDVDDEVIRATDNTVDAEPDVSEDVE